MDGCRVCHSRSGSSSDFDIPFAIAFVVTVVWHLVMGIVTTRREIKQSPRALPSTYLQIPAPLSWFRSCEYSPFRLTPKKGQVPSAVGVLCMVEPVTIEACPVHDLRESSTESSGEHGRAVTITEYRAMLGYLIPWKHPIQFVALPKCPEPLGRG